MSSSGSCVWVFRHWLFGQIMISQVLAYFKFRKGSAPPGWRSSLRHCITALAVPPEILGLSPGSVAASCAREAHGAVHNWPSVVRVREGLARRDILVSFCTSDSCGRQVYGVSSDTLVRLASGLDVHCVKKQCGLAGSCFRGCMALDLRLSRVRTGVAAMSL
jgi:hypothetical protein